MDKVEWRLLQKINCFNFGSINAQKNIDRLFYANNLRPYLPSESKLSSTDRNSKQYFYKYSKTDESQIFYTWLYCAEKAQLVIEFTVNRHQLFKGQLLGFLTNAYNYSLIG